MKEQIKSALQHLIRGDEEQASAELKAVLAAKVKSIAFGSEEVAEDVEVVEEGRKGLERDDEAEQKKELEMLESGKDII